MNRKNFEMGMGMLTMCFPILQPSEEQLQTWFVLLKDIPDEEFKASVTYLCNNTAEINRSHSIPALIRSALEPLNQHLTANAAWAEVLREVRRIGSRGTPEFSNPIVKRCVDGIGWKDICASECIGVERAHFIKAFEIYSDRKLHQQKLLSNNKSLGDRHPYLIDSIDD